MTTEPTGIRWNVTCLTALIRLIGRGSLVE